MKKKLNIFFTAAELTPIAKVGGLGDVAGSLPNALHKLGYNVNSFLPFHEMIKPKDLKNYKLYKKISVPFYNSHEQVSVYKADFPGSHQPLYLFKSKKYISSGGVYSKNIVTNPFTGKRATEKDGIPIKYFFFSKAVHTFIDEEKLTYDIYHFNDWHTVAIMLLFLNDSLIPNNRNLLTIHNLGVKGMASKKIFSLLDLPKSISGSPNKKGYYCLLKLGIKYANIINTVSDKYSKEILTPEYGVGLQNDLKKRKKDLHGIVNGLDLSLFSPNKDKYLKANFNINSLNKKKIDKKFLQKKAGLPASEDIPVFGLVSRLANQKGIDLILDIIDDLAKLDAQFIFTGTGQKPIENGLKKAQKNYPDKFYFLNKFDVPFGQQIYGGADAFLMPSNFEPCGLGQMIAMEYGTVPIVRKTGGLADTVKEGKTGFVFKDKKSEQLLRAIKRAIKTYKDQKKWMQIVKNGMRADHSWDNSAKEYAALYNLLMQNN